MKEYGLTGQNSTEVVQNLPFFNVLPTSSLCHLKTLSRRQDIRRFCLEELRNIACMYVTGDFVGRQGRLVT